MATLTIDFQDGFSGDTVVVRIDGREIFNSADVNTDYSIGRADSVALEVTKGTVDVDISVPSRQSSGHLTIDVSRTPYLGVSIVDDSIEFRPSDEMFSYF